MTTRRSSARHEAAHAVMTFVLSDEDAIRELWVAERWRIVDQGEPFGHLDAGVARSDAERVLVALAGVAGEAALRGQDGQADFERAWAGASASSDMSVATVLSRKLGPDALAKAKEVVGAIVSTEPFKRMVEALAREAEAGGRMTGNQVRAVLEAAWAKEAAHVDSR